MASGPFESPECRAIECLFSRSRSSFVVQAVLAQTSRTAVYGPVRTVVWQGSVGDRRPYADQQGHAADGTKNAPRLMPRSLGGCRWFHSCRVVGKGEFFGVSKAPRKRRKEMSGATKRSALLNTGLGSSNGTLS